MKTISLLAALHATAVSAAPQAGAATPAASTGSFFAQKMHANSFYKEKVLAASKNMTDKTLAASAAKVADIPTFYWMDSSARVARVNDFVKDIAASGGNQILPIVVYNLPNRDCAAAASNGELSVAANGVEKYKEYIASVKKVLTAAPNQKFVIAWEPDSLGNLITNNNLPKCQEAAQAYRDLHVYGLKELNLPNVAIYLDAAHGGWLGWDANITPAAKLFGEVYKAAGSPKAVKGVVTNVSNYNAYKFPGGSCPSIAESNKKCDESRYAAALGPLLEQNGFPAKFIIDQGRSGTQPTKQTIQGNWCNIKGSGFGTRPQAVTDDKYVEAIVWVKPGGESDGTSDRTAKRFDEKCGSQDSAQPAPEAGSWFQSYFEDLVRNANPKF